MNDPQLSDATIRHLRDGDSYPEYTRARRQAEARASRDGRVRMARGVALLVIVALAAGLTWRCGLALAEYWK